MSADEGRAADLATNEDRSVLHSALYSAYEADLSSAGWPGNSKVVFLTAFEDLESLTRYLK